MKYEVEQKFPVADMAALADRLDMLGATISKPQVEVDTYFTHPARNFAESDEALRIRRKGQSSYITYKGPKVDKTTKTRREIDLPLPLDEHSAAAWTELLEALGFTPLAEVRKSRRKAGLLWNNYMIEVSLDEVDGLGTFAELEMVVEADRIKAATARIASLAKTLQLRKSERRSYLELLLERSQPV